MSYQSEITELIEKIEQLDYSIERTKLLSEALKLSEFNNDENMQFILHHDLMSSTANSGQFHLAFVHLAWCLGKCDAEPKRFTIESVLSSYENICQALGDYSSISYEQGMKQLNDFGKRMREAGFDERSYLKLLIHYQIDCGYDKEAHDAFQELLGLQKDAYDYDSTWELHSVVQYHIHFREIEPAEQKAALLLRAHANEMAVPDYLFLSLVEIAFYKNEYRTLPHLLEKHIHFIEINARTLRVQSKYIYFQCLLNDTEKALSAFQQAQYFYFDLIAEWYQFYFFCYNRCLFRRLLKQNVDTVQIKFNPKWEFFTPDHNYSVKNLFDYFHGQAIEKATVLDKKNRNTKYNDYLVEVLNQVDDNARFQS